METITRRGPQSMSQAEFTELRSRYSSTLVDLGTGDGAWPRRFARQYDNCLAIGIDSDRAALKEAAKMAERKPARGGAPNTLFVAARIEELPQELHSTADWTTMYFPWSALLRMILTGEKELTALLDNLCAKRSRLSIVLNAEAAPDGLDKPTPSTVRKALQAPLSNAGFRITDTDWQDAAETPPTTWGGRLVKGSKRSMVALEAQR